ncbi:MAG TPA: M28 family peptidase [Vicinamibacterales bacterium]
MTKALALAIAAAALGACDQHPPPDSSPAYIGYTGESTLRQRELEARFRDRVSAQSISSLHRPLTERPHPAGSEATAALVKHLQTTLSGFGFGVAVHEYQALLSHPRSVRVTQIAPQRRDIRVTEPAIVEDATSSHRELGPGYIAYSASGTATGDVVDVHYGLPSDYDALRQKGVSVRDRIALARYGRSHRAVKVHTAQEEGARAVILYSDPEDDGPAKGLPWPNGYWRGGDMLQRGNAKFSWLWHGDPLTPGIAAKPTIDRLQPMKAPTLPRIPVVVISANEAAKLRESMTGATATRVRVAVEMDQRLRPIYNVVASLTGRDFPDRRIMLGTHHDAWTFGGVDPGTGMAALLEVAKGLGALARDGWQPSRTIELAFWDAEEFGLIGSTEYAEEFRAALQEQLIVYINTDMYMAGRFDPGGAPALRDFVSQAMRDVQAKDGSVFETWDQKWKTLGSGADFVPFQDHIGIPSLSIEFIGANGYGFGTYHSNFDSRAYVEKVADPDFAQGVVMSRVLGTLALRLSNAVILPFRYADYAERLRQAVVDIHDPTRSVDIGAWLARVEQIETAAIALSAAIDRRLEAGGSGNFAALNDRLARLEQQLADDDGSPESRWYRHVFYGWDIYSLYDGQMFPGLATAMRRGDAARVKYEGARIERAFDRMHAELTAALADVR